MTFEEKVRSMTAKEIIMAMVDSLTHPPIVNIDMSTYGYYGFIDRKFLGIKLGKKKVCFGCAATNTICQISGKKFTPNLIAIRSKRAEFINSDRTFLLNFEEAINSLRCGYVSGYNIIAKHKCNIATIFIYENIYLPRLENDYTNKDLEPYIQLANAQI